MRWIILMIGLAACCAACSDTTSDPDGWSIAEEPAPIAEDPPGATTRNNVTPPTPTPNNERPPPGEPPPPSNADPGPGPDGYEPTPSPCESPSRPPRCDQPPESFPWGTAAVFDEFVLAGSDSAPECCFDFTGDGVIDNSYGMNLAGFGFLDQINGELARAVATGAPATILEFDGLAPPGTGTFRLNWWLGAFANPAGFADVTDVLVGQDYVDAGTQPFTTFANAGIDDVHLLATDGVIRFPLVNFLPFVGPTPIRAVHLEADVDGNGFPTMRGRLGGVVVVNDLFATINRFVEDECPCLGLQQPLLEKDSGRCNADADTTTCTPECEEVANACNLYGAFGLFADVDLNGDGLNESITIGATFHAVPAKIVGVAP